MATRMQQRRGTASQWTSANPVLNAGEMGWESDTNKFKIGDGTNHWADLDYFIDINSTVNPSFGTSIVFEGATADSYETTLQVTDPTADRTITLPNVTGTVITTGNLSDITDIGVFSSTITMEGSTADAFELTLSAGDPTADRTITFPDATGTVALTSDIAEISQDAIDSALTAGTGITKTYNDGANTLTLAVDTATIQARVADVSDTEISYLNGVTSAIQTQLDDKSTASKTETFTNKTITSPTVSGLTLSDSSIVFEGATADAYETTFTVVDPTADRTITLPDATTTLVGTDTTQTLSNKTIVNPSITANITSTILANTGFYGFCYPAFGVPNLQLVFDISETEITSALVGTSVTITNSGLAGTYTVTAFESRTAFWDNQDYRIIITNGTPGFFDQNQSSAVATFTSTTTQTISTAELSYLDTVSSNIQTQLDAKLPKSGGTMTGAIAMGTSKITGLGTPTSDADAATKAYVDAATAGLNVHASVQAATTANITLASDVENGDTLDGVTLATGNRVLIKNQTTKTENGVYVVKASGAPDRADDYNAAGEVDAGDFLFVEAGTANGKTGWIQTNTITTVDSDNIEFTQFSGAGTYLAGNGLTLTGNTFTIDTAITQARVADVSDTEIGYLNGVTSAIQTQLNDKAPIASPTFTGTVTIPNGADLGTPTSATLTNATGLPISTGISGLGTGIATLLGTPSSANLASAITDETGSGSLVFATAPTLTNAVLANPIFQAPEERWSVSATAATGTIPFDILTSGILYYTSNATANWTLNVRGSSGATLNDTLATNDSITIVFFVTNGVTPYYQTGFQIDGSAVTPKWQNGSAPAAGNASSIDIYSYTIVKTGNAAFTAFGSQTKFA